MSIWVKFSIDTDRYNFIKAREIVFQISILFVKGGYPFECKNLLFQQNEKKSKCSTWG